eukprot:TRINITY_DN47422_c0_g1_i1.p3 TRINITY_DN47422_c0_g1~~TRINITY_DN47422_c0_g1_i1.p3  ORF type:complete len:125 (+),score=37.00 TRINITY_DN47422_c0_g1_i1:93-467(+)
MGANSSSTEPEVRNYAPEGHPPQWKTKEDFMRQGGPNWAEHWEKAPVGHCVDRKRKELHWFWSSSKEHNGEAKWACGGDQHEEQPSPRAPVADPYTHGRDGGWMSPTPDSLPGSPQGGIKPEHE